MIRLQTGLAATPGDLTDGLLQSHVDDWGNPTLVDRFTGCLRLPGHFESAKAILSAMEFGQQGRDG